MLLAVTGIVAGEKAKDAKDYFNLKIAEDITKIKSSAQTSSIVLFKDEDNDPDNIYKYDKVLDTATLVSKNKQGQKGNHLSDAYTTSDTTNEIAFHSWATNLGYTVSGCNIYLEDKKGDLKLIQANARFPALSPNGKYLAFEYYGTYGKDLPALYVRDLKGKGDVFVAYTTLGNTYGWSTQEFIVEDDGSVIFNSTADNLIPNDVNTQSDKFIYKDGKISLYGGNL
jgi:Tol biopolymer transport system component